MDFDKSGNLFSTITIKLVFLTYFHIENIFLFYVMYLKMFNTKDVDKQYTFPTLVKQLLFQNTQENNGILYKGLLFFYKKGIKKNWKAFCLYHPFIRYLG